MRLLIATVLAAAACCWVSAPVYASGNLLANPDAELGPGGTAETDINSPPGWTTTGAFTATRYGATGFPTAAQSSEYGGGTNFFAGGNTASSSAAQSVDVSSAAADIDAGAITATLSGLLGGYAEQADAITVLATFRGAGNASLGSVQIGPVTPAERANTTELLARSASAAVPVGTRAIEVVMTAVRNAGTSNDGYADNISLTISTAAPPTGAASTSTSLSCNRGADPGSPWTCFAGVGEGAPTGTVAFRSSRGGSFDPARCTLAAAPSRPSSASCTTIFTPGSTGTTLTAAYSGDPAHTASSGAFTIKGQGDVLFCGADPLPACPAGSRPAQVCVSAWVGDCDGKLPPPDPLQVCVSSIESCTGFGGAKPAKPGTIDLSGLPAAVSETAGCGKKASAAQVMAPTSCPVGFGVIVYSSITDRKSYDQAAATFKQLVDTERHGGGMWGAGGIANSIDTIFRLAHFENPGFATRTRTQIDKATDSMFACLAKPGSDGELCAPDPSDQPDCGSVLGLPTPTLTTTSKADQRICADIVLVWANALLNVKTTLLKLKAQAGVDKPFKDSGSRLLAAATRRRTFTLLYAGSAVISRGKHKAVKLKLATGARARLRALRAAGPRASAQLLVVRARIPGLAPVTRTKALHLVLGRSRGARR